MAAPAIPCSKDALQTHAEGQPTETPVSGGRAAATELIMKGN
jgi:hypothetical protein